MLINLNCNDTRTSLYFECGQDETTEAVQKRALELHNYQQFLTKLKDLLVDLGKHGQLRRAEGRGLDETLEGEELGPDQDPQKYRDGMRPNERGQELLAECVQGITKACKTMPETRSPVRREDFDAVMEMIKGSLMIIYPGGMRSDETLKEAIDQVKDYIAGNFNEDGFYNVESGAVFFASKPLTGRGETMKAMNCPANATLKVIPSKSASYAPRSNEDASKAEMMRFIYQKEMEKKRAELMTEDDVLGRQWADDQSLKRQYHGLSDVRFK